MQRFPLLPLHSMERGKKKRKKGKWRGCALKRRQHSERGTRESERQMDTELWSEAQKGAMVPGDEAG